MQKKLVIDLGEGSGNRPDFGKGDNGMSKSQNGDYSRLSSRAAMRTSGSPKRSNS